MRRMRRRFQAEAASSSNRIWCRAPAGRISAWRSSRNSSNSSRSSAAMTTWAAVSPCLRAFWEERALPSAVLWPVLRCALAALAVWRASENIWMLLEWFDFGSDYRDGLAGGAGAGAPGPRGGSAPGLHLDPQFWEN